MYLQYIYGRCFTATLGQELPVYSANIQNLYQLLTMLSTFLIKFNTFICVKHLLYNVLWF